MLYDYCLVDEIIKFHVNAVGLPEEKAIANQGVKVVRKFKVSMIAEYGCNSHFSRIHYLHDNMVILHFSGYPEMKWKRHASDTCNFRPIEM